MWQMLTINHHFDVFCIVISSPFGKIFSLTWGFGQRVLWAVFLLTLGLCTTPGMKWSLWEYVRRRRNVRLSRLVSARVSCLALFTGRLASPHLLPLSFPFPLLSSILISSKPLILWRDSTPHPRDNPINGLNSSYWHNLNHWHKRTAWSFHASVVNPGKFTLRLSSHTDSNCLPILLYPRRCIYIMPQPPTFACISTLPTLDCAYSQQTCLVLLHHSLNHMLTTSSQANTR